MALVAMSAYYKFLLLVIMNVCIYVCMFVDIFHVICNKLTHRIMRVINFYYLYIYIVFINCINK